MASGVSDTGRGNARLNEYDKLEWRDVARRLRPKWTDEEFDTAWAEFATLKDAREAAGCAPVLN